MQTIEEKILYISESVTDWLKFAEAKNAAILVFSGASITAIISFLGSSYKITQPWKLGMYAGIVFLSISCLISILSFIPKTNIFFKKRVNPTDTDNLYFYGDLCKYSPQQLIKALSRLYFDDNMSIDLSRSNIDIAAQIVINSRIAMDKFYLFKVSAWFVLVAMISIPFVPVIFLLFTGGNE